MTKDARNSIYLWVGGLAFFGLIWVASHFHVLGGIPDTWFWPLLGIMALVDLAQSAWGFWKRRASNPGNPNHR